MNKFEHKVLLVDDDPSLLEGMQRNFEDKFFIVTAQNAEDALRLVRDEGPFAVVISDMRMPVVDGAHFLNSVMEIAPKTVRIMLTGYANIENAISAVNEGHVFRFVTKPCSDDAMEKIINSALAQYELLMTEEKLLEKTLHGSISLLVDMLAIANPMAFSRTMRIHFYSSQMAKAMGFKDVWQYEIAALLSQIGCVTIPSDTLEKVFMEEDLSPEERLMFDEHPKIAYKLVAHIPRLETVARMIENQKTAYTALMERTTSILDDTALMGAEILKVATDFDILLLRGTPKDEAERILERRKGVYNPTLVALLPRVQTIEIEKVTKTIDVRSLHNRMVVAEDIRTDGGLLLLVKGQTINDTIRHCLQNYDNRRQIKSRIRVSMQGGPQ